MRLNRYSFAASIASNARRDGQPSCSQADSVRADQNVERPTFNGLGIAPTKSKRRSVVRDTLNSLATSLGRKSNRSETGTPGEHSTCGKTNLSRSTMFKLASSELPVKKKSSAKIFSDASGEARLPRPPLKEPEKCGVRGAVSPVRLDIAASELRSY